MYGDSNSKIEQLIENGFDFKFGDYISQGFEIFQKDMGNFILFSLLAVIGITLLIWVPVVGWFGLIPILTAGVYIYAHKLHTGQQTTFSDFFKGFDNWGQLTMVGLMLFLFGQIASVPYYLTNTEIFSWYGELISDPEWAMQNQPPQPPLWAIPLQFLPWFVYALYIWAIPFVVFNKMKFWDAMEASRKLVSTNYLLIFAFFLVITLIGMVGAIVCCIGIFATYPAYLCMSYASFADVTQLNVEPDGNAGIEEHLVE